MNALLKPGMRVLERFSFARKFQLLSLMFILPLGYGAWSIAQTHMERLEVVENERAGVRQIQAIGVLESELATQRNLAARWKSLERNRQETPESAAAARRLADREGQLAEQLKQLDQVLNAAGASEPVLKGLNALVAARGDLTGQSLASVGWWPDAYDRFTGVLHELSTMRDQVAIDSGLILDPWLETYLLMQIGTSSLPQLREQLGVLASVGENVAVAGHFSLQSRLQLREMRSAIGATRLQLDKLTKALEGKVPPSLEDWQIQYRQHLEQVDAWLNELDTRMFGSTLDMPAETFDQGMDQALGHVGELQRLTLGSLDARLGEYGEMNMSSLVLTLGAFVVLVILALYTLVCLQTSIRSGAARITALAESLRAGDLTGQVKVFGKDELAKIATELNEAVRQLRASLQGVNEESSNLGDTVVVLSEQAEEALKSVSQQQAQVSQIAAAATEMAATAQSVAKSCELAAQDAGQTRQIAEQSTERSVKTTASMRQLTERLGSTANALSELAQQAQRIDRVVDVIKGIAEQTNLLALNAAIEAARAGEQGRGFAVVADEVRSLSQRTQESTAEISQTVESLQRVVQQAVELMQAACTQATDDAGAVTGLGQHMEEIAVAVQRVTDMIAQIATAVEQQAITADDVSNNIQQVDHAAARLLEGSQEVHRVADRLSDGSKSLARNTSHFRLG